jgi:hypothetical protein
VIRDIERAANTVIIGFATFLMLRPLEIRKHIVISPALVALITPPIKIHPMAANIDHGVHRAGTAKHFTPWVIEPSVVQLHLRLCGIIPITFGLKQFSERGGNVDLLFFVTAAGFQQQNL